MSRFSQRGERKRVSHNHAEGQKGRGFVSKTCRAAMRETRSSFPFLSVSDPKFFITSPHTYHTHTTMNMLLTSTSVSSTCATRSTLPPPPPPRGTAAAAAAVFIKRREGFHHHHHHRPVVAESARTKIIGRLHFRRRFIVV